MNSPSLGAQLPERDGLLGRQVNDDEAVDTALLAVLDKAVLAVPQERVVVAHEHDGGLEAPVARIADHLEGRLEGDAILEGDLRAVVLAAVVFGDEARGKGWIGGEGAAYSVGGLDGRAIGDGVGEGSADLDHI